MIYRQLGKSALRVSTLCLGTMNFGPRTTEADAHLILDEAVAQGINFIDTANQYGGACGVGVSESIIGRWLRQDPARRQTIVLATKVYEPMSADVNDRGLSARHIQMACEASLRRLNVEHIDLYQMHHIDRTARPEEIWQAMDRLIAQGKITYVGSSNFPGWKIAQMNETARVRQGLGIVSEQGLYNLMERRAELEVLPACCEYGVGMIVWSPLAGGLLAGPGSETTGRRLSPHIQEAARTRARQLSAFTQLCAELGQPPAVIALAWLSLQQGVVSAIIGPASRAQLTGLMPCLETRIDADTLARIDAIFPPCGPAPEAYAW